MRAFFPGGAFFSRLRSWNAAGNSRPNPLTIYVRHSWRPANAGHSRSRPSLFCPLPFIVSGRCLPGTRIFPPDGMISRHALQCKRRDALRFPALRTFFSGGWPFCAGGRLSHFLVSLFNNFKAVLGTHQRSDPHRAQFLPECMHLLDCGEGWSKSGFHQTSPHAYDPGEPPGIPLFPRP